jgi:hypothetical protein
MAKVQMVKWPNVCGFGFLVLANASCLTTNASLPQDLFDWKKASRQEASWHRAGGGIRHWWIRHLWFGMRHSQRPFKPTLLRALSCLMPNA